MRAVIPAYAKPHDKAHFYIRFGVIPKTGRSRRWDRPKPGFHRGLSCYSATFKTGKWWTEDGSLNFVGCETLYSLRKSARKILLLQGNRVDTGPDNEPIIANVTIVATLTKAEILVPHLEDPATKVKHQAWLERRRLK